MSNAIQQLARELSLIKRQIAHLSQPQLAYSSIEDGAVQSYNAGGGLRLILGGQSDGTQAAMAVNGEAPPAPSTPVVTPVPLGLLIRWDGNNADGTDVQPLDWSRVEIHVSDTIGFTPDVTTLKATIETPQGGVYPFGVDAYTASPFYVVLRARNTSGTASAASAEASGVVQNAVPPGSITATEIADDSITTPKLHATAIDGMTITGATLRTADPSAPGTRAVVISDVGGTNSIDFHPGVPVFDEGHLIVDALDDGGGLRSFVTLQGPVLDSSVDAASLNLYTLNIDNDDLFTRGCLIDADFFSAPGITYDSSTNELALVGDVTVNSRPLPRIEYGSVTINTTSGGASGSASATIDYADFASTPKVLVAIANATGSGVYVLRVTSKSATSATVKLYTGDGSTYSSTAGIAVDWVALGAS